MRFWDLGSGIIAFSLWTRFLFKPGTAASESKFDRPILCRK